MREMECFGVLYSKSAMECVDCGLVKECIKVTEDFTGRVKRSSLNMDTTNLRAEFVKAHKEKFEESEDLTYNQLTDLAWKTARRFGLLLNMTGSTFKYFTIERVLVMTLYPSTGKFMLDYPYQGMMCLGNAKKIEESAETIFQVKDKICEDSAAWNWKKYPDRFNRVRVPGKKPYRMKGGHYNEKNGTDGLDNHSRTEGMAYRGSEAAGTHCVEVTPQDHQSASEEASRENYTKVRRFRWSWKNCLPTVRQPRRAKGSTSKTMPLSCSSWGRKSQRHLKTLFQRMVNFTTTNSNSTPSWMPSKIVGEIMPGTRIGSGVVTSAVPIEISTTSWRSLLTCRSDSDRSLTEMVSRMDSKKRLKARARRIKKERSSTAKRIRNRQAEFQAVLNDSLLRPTAIERNAIFVEYTKKFYRTDHPNGGLAPGYCSCCGQDALSVNFIKKMYDENICHRIAWDKIRMCPACNDVSRILMEQAEREEEFLKENLPNACQTEESGV